MARLSMGSTKIGLRTDTKSLARTATVSTGSSSASDDHSVRVIKLSEYREATQCLAEAFRDDDVANYFVRTGENKKRSDEQNWKLHVFILECLVRAHIMKGLVTAIGPNYDCIALWLPPGKEFDDFTTSVRSRLFLLRYKLSKEARQRFFTEFLPVLHETKTRVLGKEDDRSWYLVYIGTKPGSRGRGYAKTLIEHATKQADAENRMTYLECSNDMNIKLYNRCGFTVVDQCVLKRGSKPIRMDIMTRPPSCLSPISEASDDMMKVKIG